MTSIDRAAARLEDLLVERLTAWAEANWPEHETFAFGLIYSIGWPPVPAPGIGTVQERDAWLADPDEYGAGLMIWNPAEYVTYDPGFSDAVPEEALEIAERLNETWMDRDGDGAWGDFMGRVASRLGSQDWSGQSTTSDFAVYATDAEINDEAELLAQLRRSVSRDALAEMQRRGLTYIAT